MKSLAKKQGVDGMKKYRSFGACHVRNGKGTSYIPPVKRKWPLKNIL